MKTREIKFRAWDNELRHIIYSDEYNSLSDFFKEVENRKQKFMQHTGLKDKNGKEIYEGDIVEARFEYASDKWVVEWEDYFENNGYGFIGFLPYLKDDWEHMEIIGNIYENPELLNNGKP